MKYVLIYLIVVGSGYGGGPATGNAEFDSEAACKAAVLSIEKLQQGWNAKASLAWGECFPKSELTYK